MATIGDNEFVLSGECQWTWCALLCSCTFFTDDGFPGLQLIFVWNFELGLHEIKHEFRYFEGIQIRILLLISLCSSSLGLPNLPTSMSVRSLPRFAYSIALPVRSSRNNLEIPYLSKTNSASKDRWKILQPLLPEPICTSMLSFLIP